MKQLQSAYQQTGNQQNLRVASVLQPNKQTKPQTAREEYERIVVAKMNKRYAVN